MKKKGLLQRKEIRIQSKNQVLIKTGENNYETAELGNISRTGLFLNLPEDSLLAVSLGLEMDAKIRLSDNSKEIQFKIKVRRMEQNKGLKIVELGVNIISIKKKDKILLADFFDEVNIYGWFC